MKNGSSQVGFSQRVQLVWLDYTAGPVLTGKEKSTINDALQDYLKDRLSVGGSAVRGTREKVITILMKIWAIPPDHLQGLRDDGLALLRRLPSRDRVPDLFRQDSPDVREREMSPVDKAFPTRKHAAALV